MRPTARTRPGTQPSAFAIAPSHVADNEALCLKARSSVGSEALRSRDAIPLGLDFHDSPPAAPLIGEPVEQDDIIDAARSIVKPLFPCTHCRHPSLVADYYCHILEIEMYSYDYMNITPATTLRSTHTKSSYSWFLSGHFLITPYFITSMTWRDEISRSNIRSNSDPTSQDLTSHGIGESPSTPPSASAVHGRRRSVSHRPITMIGSQWSQSRSACGSSAAPLFSLRARSRKTPRPGA